MSRSRRSKMRASRSCGNHGGCPWCEGNRLHCSAKRSVAADLEDGLYEYEDSVYDCLGCVFCESTDCDGVGAAAFCEVA